jgi:RNA polymerase sigma factor (sigma-70 family)
MVPCHMAVPLDALSSAGRIDGDERVEVGPTELTTRIQALHPQCYGWALACCDNRREDAEDVLQDVYVGALENGLRFNGTSTLKTWLFGVIRQKARASLRQERLREFLGMRNAARIDIPTASPSPDASAVAADEREATRRALAQLPRRQREVMLLVFYHDMTIEESAKAMDVSLGSARTHYDRGKKRLATLLNGKHP